MARTFISQPTQVFNSETYNDAFATGTALSSSAVSLEDDLNALRTQTRQILWAGAAGNWYDGVQGVANVAPARGLNTINSSVTTLEQHRFLYDIQSQAFVDVPSGSNWVGLSISGSTAPIGLAAVGLGTTTGSFTGTIVATLPGPAWTAHSLNLISGTSVGSPRNLVKIRDAYTNQTIYDATQGNSEVFGLLQIDSAATDGTALADTSPGRTQISFVIENISGTIVTASVAAIGGKIINYVYRNRTNLLGLPDDAYSNTVFVDVTPTVSGFAVLSDITLQQAINGQGNTLVNQNGYFSQINLAGSGLAGSWGFLSGTQTLWRVLADTNTVVVGANNALFNNLTASFLSGISVATGSAAIDIGIALGTIATRNGQTLYLSGAQQLRFGDNFGTGSSIPFATSSVDWSTFYTNFGTGASILGTLNQISSSLSGSLRRTRASAGTTVGGTGISAGTNVTYPTNLDAPLLSYVGRDFVKDLNIYLNGVLLLPGYSVSDPNDVYPGTSPATGDLMFSMKLRSGSIISMERF